MTDVVESLKLITREKSRRTAEYAFGYAFLNHRKKVTAVHKVRCLLCKGCRLSTGLASQLCQHWRKDSGCYIFDVACCIQARLHACGAGQRHKRAGSLQLVCTRHCIAWNTKG